MRREHPAPEKWLEHPAPGRPSHHHTCRPASRILPLFLSTFFLGCSMFDVLRAQSVSAPNAEAIAPVAAPATKSAPASPPLNPIPSRYVGTDLEAYIAAFSAMFPMGQRETDPFGRLQDPEAKPIVRPTITKTSERVMETATPFSEIVRRIEVNTVMPGEKRFLVGTRSIKEGDEIPLNFRGSQIKVLVQEVSARRIVFKNQETGETGVNELNLLPPGMTPGNDGITAPGMVPVDSNAPLNLDANIP